MGPVQLHDVEVDRAALVAHVARRQFAIDHLDDDGARADARRWTEAHGQDVRCLAVGSGVGSPRLWVSSVGEELALLGFDPEPSEAVSEALRTVVPAFAVAQGFRRLSAGIGSHDTSLAVVTRDFTPFAHRMRLELDGVPTDAGGVHLRPMSAERWARWSAAQQEAYTATRVRSGESAEQARRVAAEQLAGYLPDGFDTPDHHFFVGSSTGHVADGAEVGTLWLATVRPTAFVYDLRVHPDHQRQGHGAAMMRAAARWAAERGAPAIALNVFAHNTGARALYDRLGYVVYEEAVALDLAPDAGEGLR